MTPADYSPNTTLENGPASLAHDWRQAARNRGFGHMLIVSPIPSHPITHGNRARLVQFAERLRAHGYRLTFLYSPSYIVPEADEIAMRAFWDHVEISAYVPGARKVEPDHGNRLDDWADPRLPAQIKAITDTLQVDAILVNYVWMSDCLKAVPADICKIIDTHDVFGDRHAKLRAEGVEISFFSTSIEEESLGLDRTDLVIAIQEEEAKTLQSRTKRPVHTIGHCPPATYLDKRERAPSDRIKIGYFASDNPLNRRATALLTAALKAQPTALETAEWYLVGSIAKTDEGASWPGHVTPWVDSPLDFYRAVDLVINPHMGGTGLKIKTVEAMTHGKPFIGTLDATVGLPVRHAFHQLTTPEAVIEAAKAIVGDEKDLDALAAESRDVIGRYEKEQDQNFHRLFSLAADHTDKGLINMDGAR